MRPLLFCYSAVSLAQSLAQVWGQLPPVAQQGNLTASVQVQSLRQFYWVRELPPHDEVPGIGRLGYFGSEKPITLIWRNGPGPKSWVHSLLPNTWQSQPTETSINSLPKSRETSTIQIEIE